MSTIRAYLGFLCFVFLAQFAHGADTIRAYLGTAGLTDVGYRFYTQTTAAGSRQTSGIVDEGDGWYSTAGVTLAGDHVRWDSTGTADAIAREDLSQRILLKTNLDAAISTRSTYAGGDTSGTTTLLTRLPSALTLTAGKVDINDKTGFSLSTAPPTAAQIATIIWTDGTGTSDFTISGSIGKRIADDLDAAVSTRSTYAGGDTSGTTTLLSRVTSTRAGYLDNISVTPLTIAQIWGEPLAGYTTAGTAGKTLASAGAAADPLNVTIPGSYADHTVGKIISRLDIAPLTSPVTAVPGAPSDASTCRVYAYLETLDNKPAANVSIKFQLVALTPEKSERLISGREITVVTDSQGRVADSAGDPYLDLQRNDHITPAGTTYRVLCKELFLNTTITLNGDTFDLASVIP